MIDLTSPQPPEEESDPLTPAELVYPSGTEMENLLNLILEGDKQPPEEESDPLTPADAMGEVQSCWIEDPVKGFIPSYRFFGLVAEGQPRPYRRFLKGERESVARYFMCLICETIFGESPLLVEQLEDRIVFRDNPEWANAPFLTVSDRGDYAMSDGSSLFDVEFSTTDLSEKTDTE